MLARGEDAIRQRLARLSPPAVSNTASQVAGVGEVLRPAGPPDVSPVAPVPSEAAAPAGAAAPEPYVPPIPVAALDTAEGVVPVDPLLPGAVSASVEHPPVAPALPFATLTTFDRILAPSKQRDRTFFIALGIVFGLHFIALVGALELGERVPDLARSDDRGQVDKSTTVEVEFVEAPSETAAKKEASQQGEKVQPTPPVPQVQPQEAQPEQQEVKEAKAEPVPDKPDKPKEREKPKEKPLSIDDFDVSMADYAKAVERAEAQRKQDKKEQQVARPHERAEDFSAGRAGRHTPYSTATLAMLSRTKPELFITRGQVYVRFELDRAGKVKWLQVLKSSNDTLLDSTIVDWLKRAKYEVPPPDATMDDLVYDINFTVR